MFQCFNFFLVYCIVSFCGAKLFAIRFEQLMHIVRELPISVGVTVHTVCGDGFSVVETDIKRETTTVVNEWIGAAISGKFPYGVLGAYFFLKRKQ